MPGSSFSPRNIIDAIEESDDLFGGRIADTTSNDINIPSHYRFSPERVRLFRNGSREFPQYNSVSQFSDEPDVWRLQPDAGDTMHIETAESTLYQVGYSLTASWALQINQPLTTGDRFRAGIYDASDGWFMEQRGGDHADDEVDLIERSGGSRRVLAADVTLPKPITGWHRYNLEHAWYNVAKQVWTQTYTQDVPVDSEFAEAQVNETFAETAQTDFDRGPESGNLNIRYEVTADAGTSGLELIGGSMGGTTLGDVRSLERSKPQLVRTDITTADVWEPIYAIRIAPEDDNVNATLSRIEILNYGNNALVELLAVNVDDTKTDATGWADPEYHHNYNSALQATENISEVPNANGTQTVLGTDEKFGGYTLAASSIDAGGTVTTTTATTTAGEEVKKNILTSDHTVFLARTSNAGATLAFEWNAAQMW